MRNYLEGPGENFAAFICRNDVDLAANRARVICAHVTVRSVGPLPGVLLTLRVGKRIVGCVWTGQISVFSMKV